MLAHKTALAGGFRFALLGDDLLHDAREDFRTLSGEFGEDFAIELEAGLLESGDERAV